MALNIEKLKTITDCNARDYLRQAYEIAWKKSTDINTKTGAIIVSGIDYAISSGYNHLTEGIENIPEWKERPLKYTGTVHSEIDAITKAASNGISTYRATMYMPWIPCTECYKSIKNSGIKALIAHKEMIMMSPEQWEKDLNTTLFLAEKSNFPIILYTGKIGGVKALFNGNIWEP